MNLLIDECCDSYLVNSLRNEGHDIVYVSETYRGMDDESIIQVAFTENRIIKTEDKDFGELIYRLKLATQEIILLRFEVSERANKIPRVIKILKDQSLNLFDSFTILENDKIRIRPLIK